MHIQKLEPHEMAHFKSLIEIFKTVFENSAATANEEHLRKLLSNPDFMVFVVKVNDTVVGGLTVYVLNTYMSEKPIAYIYDLGISPGFQGQGLGKALMAEVCHFCSSNGFENVYVEAESEDTDAVSFYRKTRFSYETHAIHFTYNLC